ncbi:hypothetical protein V6Z11_A01G181000 [Gossypium hirsutum]
MFIIFQVLIYVSRVSLVNKAVAGKSDQGSGPSQPHKIHAHKIHSLVSVGSKFTQRQTAEVSYDAQVMKVIFSGTCLLKTNTNKPARVEDRNTSTP